MRKNLLKLGVVAALAFGSYSIANATPISGNIAFSGTVTLDTTSAGTATAVTGWYLAGTSGTPYVSGADGTFASLIGSSVNFLAPWSFTYSGTGENLWTVGGFTFVLQSSGINTQGFDPITHLGSVNVTGTGYVTATGYDNTFGTWNFTTQDPPSQQQQPPALVFSFSASSGAGVPDGGTTVALLGLALAGMGIVRRKLKI